MIVGEKFLVIGSNSFSGASFVDYLLEQGAQVIGTSRSPEPHRAFLPYRWHGKDGAFRFHRIDLNHDLDGLMSLVHDERPEYVVNFAAQSMVAESWKHPDHWIMTNVVSTVRLHDRLRQVRFPEEVRARHDARGLRQHPGLHQRRCAVQSEHALRGLARRRGHEPEDVRGCLQVSGCFHACCQRLRPGAAALPHHSSHHPLHPARTTVAAARGRPVAPLVHPHAGRVGGDARDCTRSADRRDVSHLDRRDRYHPRTRGAHLHEARRSIRRLGRDCRRAARQGRRLHARQHQAA